VTGQPAAGRRGKIGKKWVYHTRKKDKKKPLDFSKGFTFLIV
jgi:hypothetical protein